MADKWSRFQSRCFLLKIIIGSLSRCFCSCVCKNVRMGGKQLYFCVCVLFFNHYPVCSAEISRVHDGGGRATLAVYVKAQHCLMLHKAFVHSQSSVCVCVCMYPGWGGGPAPGCTRGCMCMWICDWNGFRCLFFFSPFFQQPMKVICKVAFFVVTWNWLFLVEWTWSGIGALCHHADPSVPHSAASPTPLTHVVVFVTTDGNAKLFMSKSYRWFYVDFNCCAAVCLTTTVSFLFLIHITDLNKVLLI